MKRLLWQRAKQFDDKYALALVNPGDANLILLRGLFARVKAARGGQRQSFNERAAAAMDQWFCSLRAVLPSQAYARLSDEFLTDDKKDRESTLAACCAELWDALFSARPPKRLTRTDRNACIVPIRFDIWWYRLVTTQGHR